MTETESPDNTIWKNPIHFVAFGFGTGLLKPAPGTWGTLAAVPIFVFLSYLHWIPYALVVIGICLLGVWLSDETSKSLGEHDHPGIVIDEMAGYLITMFAAPAELTWIVVGFVLFRIFDILKPPPIRNIDKSVEGGAGIMLDDIVAGLMACVCLHILMLIF